CWIRQGESSDLLRFGDFPNTDRPIRTDSRKFIAVWRKAKLISNSSILLQLRQFLPVCHVVKANAGAIEAGGQGFTVSGKSHTEQCRQLPFAVQVRLWHRQRNLANLLPRWILPEPDGEILSSRHHRFAIWQESRETDPGVVPPGGAS